MDQTKYHGYDGNCDCMCNAKKIMDGYDFDYGDCEHTFRMKQNSDNGMVNYGTSSDFTEGIDAINEHLDAERPIIVGVDHGEGGINNDGITDHWVIITGRGYDATTNQYYYTYIETARSSAYAADACDTTTNRFVLDTTDNELVDSSDYKNRELTVTQVRPNDGDTVGTTICY